VAIADIYLLAISSTSHASFRDTLDFCKHSPLYLALMDIVQKGTLITDVNVDLLLGILNKNRDHYKNWKSGDSNCSVSNEEGKFSEVTCKIAVPIPNNPDSGNIFNCQA
jgi:hypothetical protein